MKAGSNNGWRSQLQTKQILDRQGNVVGRQTLSNILNISLILTHHPAWEGLLVFNEFAERIEKTRPVPGVAMLANAGDVRGAWTDADTEATRVWLLANEHVGGSAKELHSAVVHTSRQNRHHPVREWLGAIEWDGTPRLERVLPDIFGAEDTPYTRGIGPLWFISAVARVMKPGCQVDYAIVLESPQGWKKNQALRQLVPEKTWFAETGISLGNKDSYQNLHGTWIYCLDEMASVHAAEVRTMRNFITGAIDRYRPSYGHFSVAVPRQNVFICTINPEGGGYFADRTGNRRFWPVKMARPADVKTIVKNRNQLWAEAKARFDKGEKWWPTEALNSICLEQQKQRVQIEPWVELIDAWVRRGCPMRDEFGNFNDRRIAVARGLSTSEVLKHCIGMKEPQMTRGLAMRAAQCLRELGFSDDAKQETHDGVRDRYYKPGNPVLRVFDAKQRNEALDREYQAAKGLRKKAVVQDGQVSHKSPTKQAPPSIEQPAQHQRSNRDPKRGS